MNSELQNLLIMYTWYSTGNTRQQAATKRPLRPWARGGDREGCDAGAQTDSTETCDVRPFWLNSIHSTASKSFGQARTGQDRTNQDTVPPTPSCAREEKAQYAVLHIVTEANAVQDWDRLSLKLQKTLRGLFYLLHYGRGHNLQVCTVLAPQGPHTLTASAIQGRPRAILLAPTPCSLGWIGFTP